MKTAHSRTRIASTAFALLAMTCAGALADPQPPIADGRYLIEVYDPYVVNQYAGCLIVSNNGRDAVPSLYDWHLPDATWCGLSDRFDWVLDNGQAVWEVYSVEATNGARAHVIKSGVGGACLIRGNNGQSGFPSLHLWTEIAQGDARYCGFRDADQLIQNGQAAWSFNAGDSNANVFFAYAAWTGAYRKDFLSFAKAPSVYPNTVDRDTFASFANGDENRWVFAFWRLD
jgi:hypothetical protein